MSLFYKKKQKKFLPVKVITFDSELEFNLEYSATGQDLFDLVCRTIGLRETWYFGLQYEDVGDEISWLKPEKKVKAQKINKKDGGYVFNFYAKYFPENVSEELAQEITQHLFFLQVKQSILSMDIYCPPEASVLLASYAVHVQFGPYDSENYKTGMLAEVARDLLPQRVIDQYQMSPSMWEDRIKLWYEDHEPMTRDEVEMEYLKIAQDLDMYGVNYFLITNKKHSELWLGVTATGLNIYEKSNKLTPKTTFQWSEVRNVRFDGKKFTIRPVDSNAPNFIFYSRNLRINKLILDLCIGNHDLYIKRRKPDTMEMQQMKAQAKEEKQRRQIERSKYAREKKMRETTEKEKLELERRLQQLEEEMRSANEALRRSEETKELYLEKNRLNEKQVQLTECKANKFKLEMDRLREYHVKAEQEKVELEKKIHEAELYVQHLTDEKDKKTTEADTLKKELYCARLAEREARSKLLDFLSKSIAPMSSESMYSSSAIAVEESPSIDSEYLSSGFVTSENDIELITNEIERNRIEYLEKSKQVQSQLRTLRSEIESMKIDENQCQLDIISEEQLRSGENKYSTLKKLRSGSTKARVAFF